MGKLLRDNASIQFFPKHFSTNPSIHWLSCLIIIYWVWNDFLFVSFPLHLYKWILQGRVVTPHPKVLACAVIYFYQYKLPDTYFLLITQDCCYFVTQVIPTLAMSGFVRYPLNMHHLFFASFMVLQLISYFLCFSPKINQFSKEDHEILIKIWIFTFIMSIPM